MENVDKMNIEDMNLISGDWTRLDGEKKVNELTFSANDKLIAKLVFDHKNDKVTVEGDLSKVTGSEDNDDFIKQYKESSEEISKIV